MAGRVAVVSTGEGGDTPGVNAAIRAVVRSIIKRGCEAWVVEEGFSGLLDVDTDKIKKVDRSFVAGILELGGTILGTVPTKQMRTHEGRKQSCLNLVRHGITKLVMIGNDWSMYGANLLHTEWGNCLKELVEEKLIDEEAAKSHPTLSLVCLPASPDNVFCDTEFSIGSDTALQRVLSCLDAIVSTATSHQRSFVIELYGQHSGWLTLMAALSCGCDYVFIPESPPMDGWENEMCSLLEKGRVLGRRCSIVLVAEGAKDRSGKPISSSYVREILETRAGHEARYTVLGELQRGGTPSPFDRVFATRLGTRAVDLITSSDFDSSQAFMIGIQGTALVDFNLDSCLAKTMSVQDAIEDKQYEKARLLRGPMFEEAYEIFHVLSRSSSVTIEREKSKGRGLRIAVMHSGAPSPGMNPAVRAIVRLGLHKGHTMLAIYEGFGGLVNGEVVEFGWMNVNGWAVMGGAELATNRVHPTAENIEAIEKNIKKFEIDVLVMCGGFDGYNAIMELQKFKQSNPGVDIPCLCIPATIANNLPGTEISIGADTALNNIINAIDKIKHSGVASRRVFIVEVMGADCGYLALLSAVASGAEKCYYNETGLTFDTLMCDLNGTISRFTNTECRVSLIITTEAASKTYNTPFIYKMFKKEGEGKFDVRQSILGHLQQGGSPSPFDRIHSARIMAKCMEFIEEWACCRPIHHRSAKIHSGVFGFEQGNIVFHPLEEITGMLNSKYRRPKNQWWEKLLDTHYQVM